MIAEIEEEVKALMAKAECADNRPLKEGLNIPDEIARREERKAQLEVAKSKMEERYAEAKRVVEAEKAEAPKSGGKKEKPLEDYQYNFTDPDSRIMKVGSGLCFEQSYNAQAAVDVEGSMLIVGGYVTNHGNDK
jgi:hypothetical protein